IALITDDVSRSGVKDHHAEELQVAIAVILYPVRKETGRRLRVNQFWPKVLNFAWKNLRGLDGQKPGFCSKAQRVFCPVSPRSSFSQANCVWAGKTSVNGEITMVDFLGVE